MASKLKGRKKPMYSAEIKVWAVSEVRSGRNTQQDVARVVGCADRQLRRWIRQADVDEGKQPGLTLAERRELHLLRRANQRLQDRLRLFEEAQDFFATETR